MEVSSVQSRSDLDTNHPLSDSLFKLRRAEEHLDALRREIDVFAEGIGNFIVGENDPEAGRKKILIAETAAPVFFGWGLLAGDFIHNTRSALDIMVSTLSRVRGNGVSGRAFPLESQLNEASRSRMKDMLRGVSPQQVALIKGLQPYHRGNGPRLLESLRLLSNDDKHRLLHPARGLIRTFRLEFLSVDPPAAIGDRKLAERLSLEPGAMLASYAIAAPGEHKVQMKYDLAFEVAFGKADGYFALLSVGDFRALHHLVVAIVERVALTLEPWSPSPDFA
jgi:hypothetical protein